MTVGDRSCPCGPVRNGPSTDRGSGPVWSRTSSALRSSATRDRSAGRARQGRSLPQAIQARDRERRRWAAIAHHGSEPLGRCPPAGQARRHRHSEPARTACRCDRVMRSPRPMQARRQRLHRRPRIRRKPRPSALRQTEAAQAAATRSTRDRKECLLPRLCHVDRQAELASALPMTLPPWVAFGFSPEAGSVRSTSSTPIRERPR
jgi:hypothetical protein